jgi:dTDP-4-dehydrorhamnose 3,5-epimerase
MELINCFIDGLIIFKPRIFEDHRGLFFESFNESKYSEYLGDELKLVQDNISISKINVLRGLHFQLPPYSQGKLVSVVKGSVLDVAVDLRKKSSTFGHHFSIELSASNRLQLWIPPGFAHGFVALEDDTIFSYKCSNYYSPQYEQTILWNDNTLEIDWKVSDPIISLKDEEGINFTTFDSPF